MVKLIRNMKINQKILIPNLLYLVLLGLAIFFFFSSKALISDLSKKQKECNSVLQEIRTAAAATRAYVHKEISYPELQKKYKELLAKMQSVKGFDLSEDFKGLWAQVNKIRTLRQENSQIEKEIDKLSEYSIEQSEPYIQETIKKLADEEERGKVTTQERLVLGEAHMNALSNYKVRLLFEKLKESLDAKGPLLAYINTLVENAEKAIPRLKGTPFEMLPKNAKKANLKIRDLTLKYIKNVEEVNLINKAIFEGIQENIKKVNNIFIKQSNTAFNKIFSYFRNLFFFILFASILGIGSSVFIARSISRVLSSSISRLSESSDQVASASKQLSSVSQSLAQSASEQVSSLEETSASLEEISSMTRQNAENATQADMLMKEAKKVLDKANQSMKELIASMGEISEASENTFKIVKSIDEIAFQTNLLALNAAVEAARAGEAGSGFAVVADEVRNLAMRSADAARNTANLIEGTVKKIQEGSALVDRTNEDFSEVGKSTTKASELVTEIAAASNEQAQGIAQINSAVVNMDKAMQQNASYAEESASASEELNHQAQRLKGVVNDLMSLIKRRDGTNGNGRQIVLNASERKGKHKAVTSKTTPGSDLEKNSSPESKAQEIKPDDVIPLDEDFEDF